MSGPGDFFAKGRSAPLPVPALEDIRQRCVDGIFLGGDFGYAYDQYLIAHRDRCALLALLDEGKQE